MENQVRIENFNLWYNGNQALHDINVSFPKNQVTAIIGSSGCGKTSLLRCINRMIERLPETKITGKIFLDDKDIYAKGCDVTAARKKIGLISQKPVLLPMNIFENVAYGPRIYGFRGKKLHEVVNNCLVSAGLWEEVKNRLKDPATSLSIGQQQRLCIARGLAVQPEVLLFDEPTSSLDPISSLRIEEEMVSLKENYTCIVVTHNIMQAARVADYILFMSDGRSIEFAPAKKLLESPQNHATKAYLEGGFILQESGYRI